MVEVPNDAIVENGYAVYTHEFKGKRYLNIRSVYTDKDTGELAIGKGMTIDVEKCDAVLTAARSLLAAGK